MDFTSFKEFFTLNNILQMLEQYRELGPLPGFFLPFVEAFIPMLPLFLFVMANAAAFGLWKGFIISWLGACTGALLLFFIIRRLGKYRFFHFIKNKEKVVKLMDWVERHGFGPLFLLLCFPFSPSAIINIVAALSRVSVYQFMLAVLFGKMVMIFTIAFIGHDVVSLIQQPMKTVIVLVVIFILWLGGRKIEHKLLEKDQKLKSK
jgi:uncharacterized membrane protein YdjX (TVP38/TMEM64 family)